MAPSKAIADEVADRTRQMQSLAEELARSSDGRRTRCSPSSIASRAGSATRSSQIQASEDQLMRAENMFKQLEAAPHADGVRREEAGGGRSRGWPRSSRSPTELDKSITAIAGREQLVNAVKAEVENVHQISARSKADLAHVTEHRGEVADAQEPGRHAAVAHRRDRRAHRRHRREAARWSTKSQTKANAIVHVLDDVRINLETLGEQKAVIDHVAEKVAQLEFMLQEARNTLRTLQHERELAERIEQGIKQLRSRTSVPEEGKRTA